MPIREFIKCGQEHSLLVVLRCRAQRDAMNECLRREAGEKNWGAFKDAKLQEASELASEGAAEGEAH